MSYGERLFNSTRKRYNVTQERIERAIKGHSGKCPIAFTVIDAYPDDVIIHTVAVDMQTIRFTLRSKRKRYIYLTPRSCQQFIADYDGGYVERAKPFNFELRSPQIVEIQDKSKYNAARAKRAAEKRAAEKAAAEAAAKAAKKTAKAPLTVPLTSRVQFVPIRPDLKGADQHIPIIVGGRSPPLQRSEEGRPLSKIRQFGIRALRS